MGQTGVGRVKIILFYAYLLLYFAVIAYETMDQLGDKACLQMLLESYPEPAAWMRMVIRVENIWMLGFFLHVAHGGAKFYNILFMLAMVICCFVSSFLEKAHVDNDCWQEVWGSWPLVIGWPIVILLLAEVEGIDGRCTLLTRESTPLVSSSQS